MAIREQGYRHWEGERIGHAFRWWTIAKATLRTAAYTKTRLAILIVLIAGAWIVPFFFGLQYFFIQGISTLRRPDDLLRENLYNVLNYWSWMWLVVFSAIVGAPAVANDLRSEALYIYLAKPLRRIDYVLGKFVATFLWLLPVGLGPALWVFFAAAGATNDALSLREPTEIFFEILLVHLILALVCAAAAVAISSLTKRWALALIAWVGAVFLLYPVSEITAEASRHNEWRYLSLRNDMLFLAGHVWELPKSRFDPDWAPALWILIGLLVAALAVFVVRILKIEVSE